jgi:hypothetical protein
MNRKATTRSTKRTGGDVVVVAVVSDYGSILCPPPPELPSFEEHHRQCDPDNTNEDDSNDTEQLRPLIVAALTPPPPLRSSRSCSTSTNTGTTKSGISMGLFLLGGTIFLVSILMAVVVMVLVLPGEYSSELFFFGGTASMAAVATSSSSLTTGTTKTCTMFTTTTWTPLDELRSPSTRLHPQSDIEDILSQSTSANEKIRTTLPFLSVDITHDRQVQHGHTTTERTSMRVHWTMGRFHHHHHQHPDENEDHPDHHLQENGPLLQDDCDIIAIQCGDQEHHLQVMDAKTLSEASASDDTGILRARRRLNGWHFGSGSSGRDWWGGSGIIHEKTWSSDSRIPTSENDARHGGWHTVQDTSTSYHSNDDDDDDDDDDDHHSNTYHHEEEKNDDQVDGDPNTHVWYISSVPSKILEQKMCLLVLYHSIQPHEYVVVSQSKILRW